MGFRGSYPQDQDHRRCLQRLEQRTGPDKDARQGRHCPNRCHSLPSVVRGPLRYPGRQEEQEGWLFVFIHFLLFCSRGSISLQAAEGTTEEAAKKSGAVLRKIESRKADAKLDPHVEDQFSTGRLYAILSSRPGQAGRADGYILEGRELDFYRGFCGCENHSEGACILICIASQSVRSVPRSRVKGVAAMYIDKYNSAQ